LSKEELTKEKLHKDKVSLQENSLVAAALDDPNTYAPNSLPFFNKDNLEVGGPSPVELRKTESSMSAK
jgi:hypothetical protein